MRQIDAMVDGFRNPIAWGALCIALATGLPTAARPLCDGIARIAQALSEGAGAQAELSLILPGGEVPAPCRVSQSLSGGKVAHCGWPFAYRAPEARQGFEALLEAALVCVGSEAEQNMDQPVNHPDAYDLVELRGQGRLLGVSLKDKAGLQQTYVFLRIAPGE